MSTPVVITHATRCVRAAPGRAVAVLAFGVAALETVWATWKLARFL